jgi:sigma-B regulation protein RsbU (phosphoserine phosphatase)
VKYTDWTINIVIPQFFIDICGYSIAGIAIAFILIGMLVVYFFGRRSIKKDVQPLNQLAASADEVAKGNFDTHLPAIHSRDEIHQLRDSFENMQQSLTRYVNELRDTTAQKASMESELKIAHDIQMDMLPKTFPPYPERDDLDIYGTLTPAKAVGGDLFDFYIRDNHLFFCIGDVSGKGIPASLFMAVTRSLFRNISAHVAAPERISFTLNNALCENNETNMFVTLFIGVLDLATGHLRYCNAGHNAPLLVGSDVGDMPCQPNLPLGIMAEFQFEAQEVVLDPATTIFLFTDGLNEAENAHHEQFGDERIAEVANRLLAKGEHQPINITYEMYQAVHDFVDGAEQSDDLTMLAIQYK